MRFGGPQLGAQTNPPFVSVNPASGAQFNPGTVGAGLDPQLAFELPVQVLRTAKTFGTSIVGTAGAGNKAIAELNNPNASGVVLYVYSLDFFVPVAMAVNLLLAGTTLTPVTAAFNMSVGGATSAARVGGGNQLTPTGNLVYTSPTLTANATFFVPLPWLVRIPANSNIQLQGQTVNQAFTCNVRWLELIA